MAAAPNQKLLSDDRIPVVILDDVKWPVPKLAPRQNEIVVPLILKVIPGILDTIGTGGRADIVKLAAAMSRENLRDLGSIIYWALERGHPDLTRDDFDNMPIGVLELIKAALVISDQTGLINRTAAPKAEGSKMGEASQTGAS